SNTGDYNYTVYDASNNPVGGGSGTWTAGQPIALNGFELNLSGVPKTNDTVTVAPTQFPNANNGNARALLNLRDEDIIGRVQTLSGTTPGLSASSAYAATMADIGVRVQSAQGSYEISQSVADNAQAQLSNEVGVNLDEEAARLIQYQQAYQAAAKILQVAQSVFDTLLNVAR
ncbi:MAG: flagellar hook-associated protein FlgK, partial [Aquabacterium sp.]